MTKNSFNSGPLKTEKKEHVLTLFSYYCLKQKNTATAHVSDRAVVLDYLFQFPFSCCEMPILI